MVEELCYRDGFEIALDNMNEKSLLDLLGFVYKKSDSTEHQKLVFMLFDSVIGRIDRISPSGTNDKVDKLLTDIQQKLENEIETAEEVNELGGMLELIEAQV